MNFVGGNKLNRKMDLIRMIKEKEQTSGGEERHARKLL